MTPMQKVLKYCAMVFAVLLSVGILSGIVAAVFGLSGGWNGHFMGSSSGERVSFTRQFEEVRSLNLDNGSGSFIIRMGDHFEVQAENVSEDFIAEVRSDGTLVVKEETGFVFFNFGFGSDEKQRVIVTIPEDFVAESAVVDNGSGRMEIEGLKTQYLELDTGSGRVDARNIQSEDTNIDTGSGAVSITNCVFGQTELDTSSGSVTLNRIEMLDLELSSGSGRVAIDGSVTGDINIDTSSGSLTLNLDASVDDYDIKCDAGSGGIWVNGKKDNDYRNNPPNAVYYMEIDGGSGRITLDFNEVR